MCEHNTHVTTFVVSLKDSVYPALIRIFLHFICTVYTSGIAKGEPGWACACPTYINCLPKSLVCPVTGIKLIYSNKAVRDSIKTVSS